MNRFLRKSAWLLLALMFVPAAIIANIKLPYIFTNNMVLQRDVKVPVWGWADKGERVKITFAGKKYSAKSGDDGKWLVYLDPLAVGGPYEMVIKGKNEITLRNILMGEVWICSGQSNMEMPLAGWGNIKNSAKEIADANYPNIRLFTVIKKIGEKPITELEQTEWKVCSPATIPEFSAVGYFFGRNLNKELNIPIGLINTSWGGTIAETWISAGAANTIDDFKEPLKQLTNLNWDKLKAEADAKGIIWNDNIEKNDAGVLNKWFEPVTDDSQWKVMNLPQLWENAGLANFDGVVWFRKEIVLSEAEAKAGITLNLAQIDDIDISYINGKQIGTTSNYSQKRNYAVGSSKLKAGKNIIAIKVIDTGGGGGIFGEPQDLSYSSTIGTTSLAGDWKYNIGINAGPKPDVTTGPNSFPTLLFNGMIYPMLPLAVRGAIWYQGESNASRAYQYQTLFPALINDWRKQFANPNMPFYFVQLANFMETNSQPVESEWAELREAQSKTLSLPNTGMAVIIDIGEAKDIHPKNKQDVGYRLSLPALNNLYNKTIEYSGPVYKSQSVEGNKIRLKFDHIGKGLVTKDKYGYLKGFSIATADKKIVWAKAYIDGNDVIVYADQVTQPVAVRYAWANNPDDASLFNQEGLPASPFRTDDWKGITQK